MGFLTDAIAEMHDYGFSDVLDSRLTAALNDAMWSICAKEAWDFLEKSMTLTFVAGNPIATNWPADFSKVTHLTIPNLGRIRPMRRETILDRYFDVLTQNGLPNYYYFIGTQLYLFPQPDTSYSATFDYIVAPPALVATTNEDPLIPARHRRVITLKALIDGYLMDDDSEQAANARQQYQERYTDMREDCLRTNYDEPDYIVVMEDDWT